MMTRAALLLLALTLPLSGCATFGVYDWMGEQEREIYKQSQNAAEAQQSAQADEALATRAEHSLADRQAAAQAQQQQKDRESAEAFIAWLKNNETYVRQLCALPAGSEGHIDALEHMRFAVSSDKDRYAEAKSRGNQYRVATCPSSDDQSVEDANPLPQILAQTVERGPAPLRPSEEYNLRVLEKHRQLKEFDDEERWRREERKREEQRLESDAAGKKRAEEQRLERIGKRIDRGFSWFFDVAMGLFLYGAFNDGEF